MGNPGKNKLLRYCRLYVGGADLSGDARMFGSADCSIEIADMTGWSQTVRWGIPSGQIAVGLRSFQALFNDTAVTGSHTVMKDPSTLNKISLLFGGNAVPAAGDPAYLTVANLEPGGVGFDGPSIVINGTWVPDAQDDSEFPWGVTLFPETALSVTTSGSTVQEAAATTKGCHAHLHVLATGSGNYAFKIEHSTNGSTWADLVTFSSNGGTVTSEQVSTSGTVNAYLRGSATRTGGTCTVVMTVARKLM